MTVATLGTITAMLIAVIVAHLWTKAVMAATLDRFHADDWIEELHPDTDPPYVRIIGPMPRLYDQDADA